MTLRLRPTLLTESPYRPASTGYKGFPTTHGGSRTKLYGAWIRMRTRCTDPEFHQWDDYGGRGITVCAEWLHDYPAFRDWALANGYQPGLTLDRWPNNDGSYEPSNCRWATRKEQNNNRRKRRWRKRP